MTIKNKFKENKKFRNTVISVVSITLTVAIILSSTLIITKVKKNKVAVGSPTENISDNTNAQTENESTAANSADESTSQFDEQNNKTESSEPVSRSGNTQTESGSQAQKPNNIGSNNGTTTTTKHNGGNTVTTTKTNSGNGGSAVNACNHNWQLISYTNGCYVYHCSKCDDYKTEEREMNPNDFMGNKSEYLELLSLVNKARREAGLNELIYIDEFQKGADIRARELTVSYSHTRPNGESFQTVYNALGRRERFGGGGENIVVNASTAEQAFGSWMHSKGHRAEILREGATHFVASRCDEYWVMSTFVPYENIQ